MIDAYPLQWPEAQPRTPASQIDSSRFSPGGRVKCAGDVRDELHRLGATNLIISTNLRLRQDGGFYSKQRLPDDRGVAVYFDYLGSQKCFACDRWFTIEENLRAIFKSIEAIRGLDRWGSKSFVEAAFTGFTALPAPVQTKFWWEVLGVSQNANRQAIQSAYRAKAMNIHRHGGDLAELNVARDQALEEVA